MDQNPYASPEQTGREADEPEAPRPRVTRILKRIAPLSLAKLLGIFYVLLGACFIPFAFLVDGMSPQLIFLPPAYGVMGFLVGLLFACGFNVCSSVAGGLEVEIE